MAMDVASAPLVAPARFDAWRFVGRYGALIVLAALIAGVALVEPETFATKSNVLNVLDQSALAAIVAMGLTFPLVAGEFDPSVGYVGSACGVIACELIVASGFSIPAAFAVAIVFGAFVGLVNGLVITKIGVHALVATLGVGTLVVGVNFAIAGGVPVTLDDPESFINLTLGKFLGIPYPVYVMFGVVAVLWVLLNRTVAAQSMRAVGGNPVAARLSGVRVDRIRVLVFVIAGMCAAVTGVLLAPRMGSAAVNGADGYLLSAFAASFFDSAVRRDGQFHIVGTLVGVLTVAVGFSAITLLRLSTYYQYLFQGALLIVGVGVGTLAGQRTVR
jgi:ribose transport system permease protein